MAKIGGKRMIVWRAVDGEGEVIDVLVRKGCNKAAVLKLFRRLLKNDSVRDGSGSSSCQIARISPALPLNPRAVYNNFTPQQHLVSRPTLRVSRQHVFNVREAATAAA